jgi:hypothetical protein
MKLRNAANSAWITLFQLDGEWTNIAFENGTAAAPSIYFKDSGTDTGIYSPGTDQVGISAGGTSRFEVSTTATTSTLPVVHPLGAVGTPSITFTGDLDTGIYSPAADTLAFVEGGAEVARIDSSARLLIGTSTARTNFYDSASLYSPGVQLETAGSAGTEPNRFLSLTHGNAGTLGPVLLFAKHRSNSVGGNTIAVSGDEAGQINFQASDGSEFVSVAGISANVDGTPGAGDMPGRLVFSTTPDGLSTSTERMRINAAGDVLVGRTNPAAGNTGVRIASTGFLEAVIDNDAPLSVNRKNSDGNLVVFQQDNTTEGTISVSGTTVSYNGAHLSRWSQLPGGAERTEILRGTVLSNIDEMCDWGEEENEQLNRMKVSDVEADPNVAGVFQAWDDDDETYTDDFYCAMTGDFIIRIAEGVTVQRGDLLMSAGDGTAKPQDDDIIRSKTVAKVTSTHVTCTYEDGSYCVPCVLMAC